MADSDQRLPPKGVDSLPKGEKGINDRLEQVATTMFGPADESPFIYRRPSDGALVGPFPFFQVAPEAGEYVVGTFGKISAIPGLSPEAREVAILAVGAKYKAAYELYAHVNVAIKKVGMSKEVGEAIARGEKPDGLDEACSAAFDASTYLVGTPGALSKDLWDRCVKALGKEGTVALVHYVGAYAYTCIILNAMDAPVPE